MRDLDAGAEAVYLALRNGKRHDVAWDGIGEKHQHQIRTAFAAGLDAYEASEK